MLPFRWYRQAFPIWLRALLFVVVAPGTVAVLVPWLVVGIDSPWARYDTGAFRWLGVPIAIAGFLAYLPFLQSLQIRDIGEQNKAFRIHQGTLIVDPEYR